MPDPKKNRLEPRLPRGFADRGPEDIRAVERMMEKIKAVYERYGFEPVETPFVEYTEALGKFLPDQDRPNEGVFSFQDEDESWLSLRYDLTAPLARFVAENFERLPKPYRSYRAGWVFRNEKPGPGRFRQFMQFDADTVGSASPAADAEICMMAADTMEALGFERGQYVIKVNNRKILDGVLESIGLGGTANVGKRLAVLRAIDKLDRLGPEGVRALLGKGRKDESGDYTKGAELKADQIASVLKMIEVKQFKATDLGAALTGTGGDGLKEAAEIGMLITHAGYGDRIVIDASVVRGLEYYTGPVFEAELTAPITDDKGQPIRLGSVVSGGRYDGLVERFTGEKVPATGISIGVSRLLFGLQRLGKYKERATQGPVVVLVLDRDRIADYQKMAQDLRAAAIRAELYLGESGMKAQMKYADKRGSPCVVIQGGDEKANGQVQIKDLVLGAALTSIKDRDDYLKKQAEAQFAVPEANMIAAVRKVLSRHKS
jgi:histidyl-tRNA synthetase